MSAIRSDDLEAKLSALYERAQKVGEEAEQAALDAGEEARHSPHTPDVSASWREEMAILLEREMTVARPIEGEAIIEEREREREIGKRALAHLKLAQLRRIAEDQGLLSEGDLDDVSDRIVRAFNADRGEIAQLVVRYEQEPPPERRFTTRIFYLSDAIADPSTKAERAKLFAGRYMRTGIARWFVIESVDSSPQRLKLSGTFRFYRASATEEPEEDGEHEGEDAGVNRFDLVSEGASAPVTLSVAVGQASVQVEARGVAESRAAMQAIERAIGVKWQRRLPVPSRAHEGDLMQWDPRSVFMVDLLSSRFRAPGIEISNLVTAGFQTDRGPVKGEEAKPRVKTVRFQGQHLLDSRPACELLVRGEALVELGMTVQFQIDAEHRSSFPLVIRLERDHATIMTGFGVHPPTVARMLQNALTAGITKALNDGPADEAALKVLATQIKKRASNEKPVERATFFVTEDAGEGHQAHAAEGARRGGTDPSEY